MITEPDQPPGSAQLHNLPVQLTSFVGRERELDEIGGLLTTSRLVTIVGFGGVGKTRLALQAAAAALGSFTDGARLVELAALADPMLVPRAVADSLGLQEKPGRPLLATLVAHLRPGHVLLVLDNCEHLIAACADLALSLLQACPSLQILATSRQPLDVAGETELRVAPLAVPDSARLAEGADALRALMEYEAFQLFVDRARSAEPDFVLSHSNATAVAQICRELDGVPLAIELAAAWVKVLTVNQIAGRLGDRFRLLTHGRRAALPRHRTLQALVDWSYELLSPREQLLFGRLSVFAGGWTLDAAEAAGAGEGIEPGEVLDLLWRLVDRSLVLAEEQRGEMRYRLLETLREYGAEKLRESGEDALVRGRHRDWCLTLAEAAERTLRLGAQGDWLDRLEVEHDNLRTALAWSEAEPSGAEPGARLAGALWWFWHLRGFANEGLRQLEKVLAIDGEVPTWARARVLNGAGFLIYDRGDYARAVTLIEEALVLSRQVGDTWGIAYALGSLGFVARFQGDSERAVALLDEGLALARTNGDTFNVARLLNNLGVVALGQGDLTRAKAHIEESLALWQQLQSTANISLATFLLGRVAYVQEDYDRATELLEESVALSRRVGYTRSTGWALQTLAWVARARYDLERALTLSEESLALRRELGDKWGIAECFEALAGLALAHGDVHKGARLFGAAEALREAIGGPQSPTARAINEPDLTGIHAALGDEAFAAALIEGRTMPLEDAIEYALARSEPTSAVAKEREGTGGESEAELLTRRERELMLLLARGLTNRQIADALVISKRTAETHVGNILAKLGLDSRSQVAAWVVERGLQAGPPA